MIDYHIHPNYSSDARGTIDEFCQSALKNGLKEICFTTHLDSDLTRDDAYVMVDDKKVDVQSNDWLVHYESSVRQADETYRKQGLRVKLGIEVDYYPGIRENLPDQFFDTDFDVILGSVHLFDHHAISVEKESHKVFQKYTLSQLGERYYGYLINCVDTELFDILAHIDLYRRYGEQYYGKEIFNIWKPHIEQLSDAMRTKKVAFEVNTSSWRKNLTDPMPTGSLIKSLIARGIDIITIGSDAHYPEMIGNGIQRVLTYLQEIGVETVSTYEKRTPQKIPIESLIQQQEK
ncbi:MAG: histidinol-phosphatase HisJ family protein [Candidatus Lokiarchaeota archaeon]|nr:histidinol-phosphatase HisJ family protein [Candidatus Lokiarchaeota archaeon]